MSLYKQALAALTPGQELTIGDAMGDLVLPKLTSTPLVYVAGGIGISSFASMFKQLLANREEREIYLFYRLRNRREQIFRELTGSYPLALNTLAIAPHQFTAEDIVASTPPGAQLYLSGSQIFVETLRRGLAEQGIPHERIVFDYFDGYADL
jgi:ferredoxin-NADP reductase